MFLLRLFSPPTEHEELLGDLSEEYQEHWLPLGRRVARRWYWRQVLGSLRAGLDRPGRRFAPPARRGLLTSLPQDVRYGARSLLNAPLFTSLAVLILSLAIGVNTTIFSMVNVMFFSEMPMRETDTAVFVWMNNAERGVARGDVSIADYLDFRDQIEALEGVAALTLEPGTLSAVEEPTRVLIGYMTADMLQVWGLEPRLGRSFAVGEDSPGLPPVALLSHGIWERRFGGDPVAVGTEVKINGVPTTIVGVVDQQMEFGDLAAVDLWVPLPLDLGGSPRDARALLVSGRLAPDATLEQAQAEADAISTRLAEQYPETNRGWALEVADFQTGIADGEFWTLMTLLIIAVGLVLLVACSNVALMTLARGSTRTLDFAVRAAIGAGRGRLIRQLLFESLMVSLAAGVVGLLLARGSLLGLTWIAGDNGGLSEFFQMLAIDARVAMFALMVTLVAPLIFGLLPAIRASRSNLCTTLKDGGTASSPSSLRGRRVLVATQVSLAITLTVAAGLLVRGLLEVRGTTFAYDPETILTMRVDLPKVGYPELEQVRQFRRQLGEQVEREPSVVRLTWLDRRPFADGLQTATLEIAGDELRAEEQLPTASRLAVGPAYFDMLGLRVLAGRLLDTRDRPESARVAVVNSEAADRFWGDDDPVGQEIRMLDDTWLEVVGVVSNELFPDAEKPTIPLVYVPIEQHTAHGAALLIQSTNDPLALTPAIRRVVSTADPDQPISDVRTRARVYSDRFATVGAVASMLGAFAIFAFVMAGAGIYGVLAFAVEERTREFGVRMALGASRSNVVGMVMRNSFLLIGVGTTIGLLGGFGLSALMASAFPEVDPGDLLVYGIVGIGLLFVALLAAWVPLSRATRVDPVVAIRGG